ncbi:MAG: SpoU methylase protein [Acidobacteriota bacterium]|nr:SpoU methylase protein [Acidobacteriota bacterium]
MTETSNYLDNIYVVLVEPKNPGNIGSTVRAMKNMGISHLRLVNPIEYRDVIEQKKMGYRAQEIIETSEEFETLDQALSDTSLVFVATSKKGKWKKDVIYPEKAGEIIMEHNINEKIAVVFGREDSGVTIDESQTANYCITVPTAVSYPSLNLSQAVLLVLYEIYRKLAAPPLIPLPKRAEKVSYDRLYDNIWRLMKGILIREPEKGLFHRSLKRALNRTTWTNADIAVFDRFCKQVRWFINNHKKEDFEGEPDDPYLPGDMENEE